MSPDTSFSMSYVIPKMLPCCMSNLINGMSFIVSLLSLSALLHFERMKGLCDMGLSDMAKEGRDISYFLEFDMRHKSTLEATWDMAP